MSYKVIYKGVEIEASDAQAAIHLARALAAENASVTSRGLDPFIPGADLASIQRLRIRPRSVRHQNGSSPQTTTRKFLSAIKAAGRNGLGPEEVMAALGAKHAKGIGAYTASINRLLTKMGRAQHRVYKTVRTAEGRTWVPGPEIDEVLDAVTQGS